ncbi:MAG: hypothetical protein OK442_03990 [Thaumarchaeota archaeon]|nr:hypothetical protein [Nitrososphaerota archaeon]
MTSRRLSLSVLSLLLLSGVTIALAQSANAQTLSVAISGPGSGAVFNRGEVAAITASVTLAGSPVSGAVVTATNPTGGQISLSPTATPGTYSGQYEVQASDPVGAWTINVQAVSGAQAASAHTTVSISGSLVVSVVSPPIGSVFNVGQSVTVDATVTYQDGSPLPSSAIVGFANPKGGVVPMTVDSADSSGKTWTGNYTILASDVPANGVTWPITVSATSSGNTGSSVLSVSLFKTLLVGVSTFGSSTFTAPQTNFQIGQTVYVKAAVTLHDGTTVSSGAAFFTITGTTIFSTSMPMTYVLPMNAWTGSYTFQPADQQGAQTVTVSAADSNGNTGSGSQQITVGAQSLSVSITSPSAGSVFNNGQGVTISASVSVAGTPATAATVTANSPSGATISLANTGLGTYSARYTIFSIDPTGTWLIAADAAQGGLSGSAQEAVTVSSALNVAVSTWSSSFFTVALTTFNVGQTVYVKALGSLQNGAIVPAGVVTFAITGTSTASSPVAMTFSSSLDAWIGSYTILGSDHVGGQTITVSAADTTGNSGTGTSQITIGVQGLSVSITSPASGSSFNRGQTLTISASVAAAGSPATSATVTANSPSGGMITLVNQGSGTYAALYTILSTDPTGTWTITVQATQGGLSGSAQVAVTIGAVPPTSQALEAIITLNPSTHNIEVNAVCNTTAGCVGPTTITNSSTSTHGGHGDGDGVGDANDHGQGQGDGQGSGQGHGQGGNDQGQGNWMGGATLFTFVIKDTAGHSLTLNVSLNSDGNHVMASVVSIRYGTATPITAESNFIGFDLANGWGGWGDMTTFTEWASVNGTSYLGQFDAQNDATTITTRTDWQPGTNTTSSGLWLFELVTTGGTLSMNPVPVSAASTTTSVSCAAAQSDQHGSRGNSGVWCTATVTGNDPTGTVNWSSSVTTGQFMPSSCQLDQNGTCSVRYIQGSTGTATVTASYSGDGFNGPSSGTGTVTTAPPTPGTSITTISCRVVEQQLGTSGQELRCNAYIYGKNPSGTVTWSSSSSGTFSSTTCTLGSGGGDSGSGSWPQGDQCQVTYTQTSAGTVTISASYAGDQNNLPSSASVTFSIA